MTKVPVMKKKKKWYTLINKRKENLKVTKNILVPISCMTIDYSDTSIRPVIAGRLAEEKLDNQRRVENRKVTRWVWVNSSNIIHWNLKLSINKHFFFFQLFVSPPRER